MDAAPSNSNPKRLRNLSAQRGTGQNRPSPVRIPRLETVAPTVQQHLPGGGNHHRHLDGPVGRSGRSRAFARSIGSGFSEKGHGGLRPPGLQRGHLFMDVAL